MLCICLVLDSRCLVQLGGQLGQARQTERASPPFDGVGLLLKIAPRSRIKALLQRLQLGRKFIFVACLDLLKARHRFKSQPRPFRAGRLIKVCK